MNKSDFCRKGDHQKKLCWGVIMEWVILHLQSSPKFQCLKIVKVYLLLQCNLMSVSCDSAPHSHSGTQAGGRTNISVCSLDSCHSGGKERGAGDFPTSLKRISTFWSTNDRHHIYLWPIRINQVAPLICKRVGNVGE